MSLFQNPRKMIPAILAFVGVLILAIGYSSCHAAEIELAYGRTIIRGPTDVAALTVVWPKQIGGIDLFAGAMLIGDYSYGGTHYNNQIVVRTGITANVKRFGVSFGVAHLQNADALNSGDLNFNLGLSWRFGKRLVVYPEMHFSNAGSHDPNTGRDMALIGIRLGDVK